MDNAVGSRELLSRVLISKKRQRLELTEDEYSILIGSVLGDSYITKLGRIQIEHGERQEAYLRWKYELLQRVTSTRIVSARRVRSGKVHTQSYRFWTRQYFHSWREYFYPKGKKILPAGIEVSLSPLSLAVWFMDDGFLRKEHEIGLATEGFKAKDVRRIASGLRAKYSISPYITGYGRLYFGRDATDRFVRLTQPYIIESMRYKFP